jgi:hypothetical protein
MALKDMLPGDPKNLKTMRVNHPKDHPDVQKVADKIYDRLEKKMLGGVGMLGDNIDKKRKMEKKATKKAKRLMDSAQTILAKKRSETEGSFSKGGRVGLKSGSKGCKLAKRGKGRAYGKNS